ncbi:protein of unknown function [Kyrpidia spormannii]|uniref:Uncharacterized protein n=1 Tax=Kyrpidia spormannii TaxID=2055160 RepID=A0ACA8ZE38_9BACL|nr:protein of unknown function [Kyrpidia spormannii]
MSHGALVYRKTNGKLRDYRQGVQDFAYRADSVSANRCAGDGGIRKNAGTGWHGNVHRPG